MRSGLVDLDIYFHEGGKELVSLREPPNNRLHLTTEPVTPFAFAKAAPWPLRGLRLQVNLHVRQYFPTNGVIVKNKLSEAVLEARPHTRSEDIRGAFFRDQTAIIHSMPFRPAKA